MPVGLTTKPPIEDKKEKPKVVVLVINDVVDLTEEAPSMQQPGVSSFQDHHAFPMDIKCTSVLECPLFKLCCGNMSSICLYIVRAGLNVFQMRFCVYARMSLIWFGSRGPSIYNFPFYSLCSLYIWHYLGGRTHSALLVLSPRIALHCWINKHHVM